MGFVATNFGFSGSSAAFVETIKAAEPITSAALCVLWQIETISPMEFWSLACIVAGVVLSTVGNQETTTTSGNTATITTTLAASFASCVIVMASNLLFSFRGLYQKLFRASHIPVSVLDDLNLQFRFQQLGVWILCIPVAIWNGPGILRHVYMVTTTPKVGLLASGILMRYMGLALLNELAFTSYK
jgi:drug/metabolite transporter (DMT)-like permease